VFDDMLATRRKAYADRLPEVRARASAISMDAMRQRRDKVAAELAAAETQADGVAFANQQQLDLLALVKSVQANLDKMPVSPETEQARARLRLASGVLTWQLADDYVGRTWQAKKELVTIDAQMAEARQRDAALAQAQRDEPARFDRFGQRIKALDPLLQAMLPKVAALRQEQQAVVQEIAVAELTRQKERLVQYATQARFAVAQLYDRANIKKDADHVAAPR